MSCGVGCRHGSDPSLLWLWRRPVATAPIRPLAWEPPYATGAAQEMAKRPKKKDKKKERESQRGNNKKERNPRDQLLARKNLSFVFFFRILLHYGLL